MKYIVSLIIAFIFIGCSGKDETQIIINDSKNRALDFIRDKKVFIDKRYNIGYYIYNKKQYFSDSQKFCKNLKVNGITNWNIPTFPEANNLINIGSRNKLFPIFNNHILNDYYWTLRKSKLKKDMRIATSFSKENPKEHREKEDKINTICTSGVKLKN